MSVTILYRMERIRMAIQTLFHGGNGQALNSVHIWKLLSAAGQENPAMVLREIAKHPSLYQSIHYMEFVKVREFKIWKTF